VIGGAAPDLVRVKVLAPLPIARPFDYLVDRSAATPGAFVRAPFGRTSVIGVIWPGAADPTVDLARLKIAEPEGDLPPLSPPVIDFVEWVAAYAMTPLGSILRLVMRGGDALNAPRGHGAWRLSGAAPGRLTEARRRALEFLEAAEGARTTREIAEGAGVSDAVVRALAAAGALIAETIDPDPPFAEPDLDRAGRTLSAAQMAALAAVRKAGAGVVLLDGVTGSGKTEVYLEAVADALRSARNAQALVMLPEIALTAPFLARVAERFGAEPAGWHSDMTAAARRRTWRRVAEGQARLIVGARSALFLPYRNLSLIIVDEEHEAAYKQDEGVIYQARDLAVARGARAGIPVLLASATPSLETVVNVDQGRYAIARIGARFGVAQLPQVSLIDLRADAPDQGRWLSEPLVAAVSDRIARGEQSLLFINRRGYAPLTICRRCGHRMKAPQSDTFLVEHRFENRLVCHHTGYSIPKPAACPACNAVGALSACGPGVERVAEEAAERWPDARRAILSSDTAQSPGRMREALGAMERGEIDILIATQVVAKGHNFPKLTLVGVVDADMGLAGGDLRAAERTFQMLSQVAGRAGRAERPGAAMLQTHAPNAAVFSALAAQDRDAFLAAEAAGREALGFPPYGRLAAILLRARNENELKATAAAHRAALFQADGVVVWGPAPAPIYRLRGEARMRFLVKSRRDVRIQGFLEEWLARVRLPAAVRRTVDIDPYSFL
jgi:primosomal protein N' (replication factor Y)